MGNDDAVVATNLAAERTLGHAGVSRLRSPSLFVEERALPFSAWPTAVVRRRRHPLKRP